MDAVPSIELLLWLQDPVASGRGFPGKSCKDHDKFGGLHASGLGVRKSRVWQLLRNEGWGGSEELLLTACRLAGSRLLT